MDISCYSTHRYDILCNLLRHPRTNTRPPVLRCLRFCSSGKTDLTKVGLNSINNETVKQNLLGKSRYMEKKGWVDAQGRQGKVGKNPNLYTCVCVW